jgi:hypothetical protein
VLHKAPYILKDEGLGLKKFFQAEDVAYRSLKFWQLIEKLVNKHPREDGLYYDLSHTGKFLEGFY